MDGQYGHSLSNIMLDLRLIEQRKEYLDVSSMGTRVDTDWISHIDHVELSRCHMGKARQGD